MRSLTNNSCLILSINMEAIKKANENETVSIIICQEGITPT